jgi:hypothetical protein
MRPRNLGSSEMSSTLTGVKATWDSGCGIRPAHIAKACLTVLMPFTGALRKISQYISCIYFSVKSFIGFFSRHKLRDTKVLHQLQKTKKYTTMITCLFETYTSIYGGNSLLGKYMMSVNVFFFDFDTSTSLLRARLRCCFEIQTM